MNYRTLHFSFSQHYISNMFGHCKFTFDFFLLLSQHFIEVSPQQSKLDDDMKD